MMSAPVASSAVLFMGRSGEQWDAYLTWSVVFAGVAAALVAFATFGSTRVHSKEAQEANNAAAASRLQLQTYQAETNGKVADARREGIEAGRTASDAQLQAAKANERAAGLERQAAEARLETARLRNELRPRQFTDKQISVLTEQIKIHVGKVFVVARGEDEPSQYAYKLIDALEKAGALDTYVITNHPLQKWTGIRLYVPGVRDPEQLTKAPLAVAFSEAGVDVVTVSSGSQVGLVLDPILEPKGRPTIYIGLQPLPKL